MDDLRNVESGVLRALTLLRRGLSPFRSLNIYVVRCSDVDIICKDFTSVARNCLSLKVKGRKMTMETESRVFQTILTLGYRNKGSNYRVTQG